MSKSRNLNVHVLPMYHDDYAEVVFWGDVHIGHPTCLVDEAQAMLKYCLDRGVPVVIMGDVIECGLTGSVGDSVYMQKLNPQEQLDEAYAWLEPLARSNLILGLHAGNHEARITKATGIDVSKYLARSLGVPYLGSACWHLFYAGKQRYSLYTLHGASGSRFIHTKLKAVTDIAHFFPSADVVAMGHVHDVASVALERQYVDLRKRTIVHQKQYCMLTGHYLGYKESYAEMKGMPPAKVGSPKVKFYANEKDVHIRT